MRKHRCWSSEQSFKRRDMIGISTRQLTLQEIRLKQKIGLITAINRTLGWFQGGSNPQLASIFGWLLFTSLRYCMIRHFRRHLKATAFRKKLTVTPKSSRGTKLVKQEPASPEPSVYRNSVSIRSSRVGVPR